MYQVAQYSLRQRLKLKKIKISSQNGMDKNILGTAIA